ncbi:MAG: cell division protein FtsZ, partial [Rhodocyclaceae bacterium]|nr:cell division protein FtsZ [Rhodocyclaceae bacterium]
GTGAAPVVAEVAKEMGVLTVGVVTKPFDFENRDRVADSGIEELSRHVDSLIVVLNDKLMEVLGDDASLEDGFRAADNVLRNAVGGIAEIINIRGLVNVDFQDVRTVMAEMGRAMMGSAEAEGIDRARISAEQAAASPLLEGVELSGARGVLINITASKTLKMSEVKEAVNTVRAFAAKDAFVIYGTVFDESMEDRMRVTVVATGLGHPVAASKPVMQVVQGTGTYGPGDTGVTGADMPAVIRNGRRNTVEAMSASGVGTLDIPAFLRKQAD